MAGVSGMTGSPWHTETIHMNEKDNPRHRAHCVHYNNKNKTCRKRAVKCYGSSHCSYYKESPEKTQEPKNDFQSQEHGFIREGNAIIYRPKSSPESVITEGKKPIQDTNNNTNSNLPHSKSKNSSTASRSEDKSNLVCPGTNNSLLLFKPGTHVMHKTYGRGVVSRVESKIIRIQFYHHGFENLQIEDCLKNDLLKLEKNKNP